MDTDLVPLFGRARVLWGVWGGRCDCPHNRDLGAGRNSVIYVRRVRGVRLFLSHNAEC